MVRRLDFHEILCEVLGNRNVYFQPPASIKLEYPCIIYSLDNINVKRANNNPYILTPRYQVIFITKNPDDERISKFLELDNSSFDRAYTKDNLKHYVYTIYY